MQTGSHEPQPTLHQPWWGAIMRLAPMGWVLILTLLVLRVIWQYLSPYTLIEDEAHYWEWARRLDWSYYSKGPGVAWVIWASTRVLGDTEFGVRLPAAIATAIGTVAMMRTTLELLEDRRLAFLSALLYNCIPGFAVAAMLMTIDAPYIACWAWGAFFALRAILDGYHRAWLGFGMCVAIGFLFKYTILMLLPSVLLALWVTRAGRPKLRWGWLGIGLAVSLLGLIPVGIWNSQHDWATVRHLLGHLGAPGGDTANTAAGPREPWTIVWFFEYIALQLLVGGPVIALAGFAWFNAPKRANERTVRTIRACVFMALPMLVFYLLISLVTQTEGNWAMAAFVTLIPPAAWAVWDGVTRVSHPIKFFWGAAIIVGIGAMLLFPGAQTIAKVPGIGELIPLYRMTGMREHALDAQRVLDDLQAQTGKQPFVITNHYGRASLLAFYLPDHPVVYCSSAHIGGRKTQYDMWDQTDLGNPDTLARLHGRPALLLGGPPKHWDSAFDAITPIEPLNNEPKSHGTAYTGLLFKSFENWVPQMRDN
ncbi:MAG: ArnT family glycosyltransferase [Phycisphaerales bacterium JB052]